MICVAIAAAAPVLAFFPAIMNADSLALYAGAVIPGPVMDWHSPFLTWLLRLLIRVGGGVAAFIGIQSAIYFFALYGILSLTRMGTVARLAAVAVVLVAPPTMPWIATAEKTSFMAALLAACLLAALRLEAGARHRLALLTALIALAAMGTWCRPNGIIVFLPVVGYAALQAARIGLPKIVPPALIAAFLMLGLGAPALAVRLGAVVPTYPEQATMDLDLLNLSLRTGQALLPQGVLAAPFAEVKRAMAPDPYLLGPLDTSLTRITANAEMRRLRSMWLAAIRAHPLTYLRYRFDLYREDLCLDLAATCLGAWHFYTGGIDDNPFGLVSHKLGYVFDFYRALAGSVPFHPFFDLIGVAAVLLGAIVIRHRVVGVFAAALLLYDLANAWLIPGVTARMAVPLGLMLPLLIGGLYAPGARPRWGEMVRARAR